MAAPPPQTFPYDYLFKVLIIGDASVGKVSGIVQFAVLEFGASLEMIPGLLVANSRFFKLVYFSHQIHPSLR